MSTRTLRLAALATLLAACGAGCTTPGMKGLGGLLGGDEKKAPADPAATYQVLFMPYEGQPEQVTRTLSGQMHIQEALEQTGALKHFRRIEVELVRPLPGGGFHRIPCEFDRATDQITPEFDYALLPGDRIVVKEDPSTMVDDMINAALGPLGTKITKKARGIENQRDEQYRIVR